MNKPERWYEVDAKTGEIYVYNTSDPKFATSCSTLRSLSDLRYYRQVFRLRRVEP